MELNQRASLSQTPKPREFRKSQKNAACESDTMKNHITHIVRSYRDFYEVSSHPHLSKQQKIKILNLIQWRTINLDSFIEEDLNKISRLLTPNQISDIFNNLRDNRGRGFFLHLEDPAGLSALTNRAIDPYIKEAHYHRIIQEYYIKLEDIDKNSLYISDKEVSNKKAEFALKAKDILEKNDKTPQENISAFMTHVTSEEIDPLIFKNRDNIFTTAIKTVGTFGLIDRYRALKGGSTKIAQNITFFKAMNNQEILPIDELMKYKGH